MQILIVTTREADFFAFSQALAREVEKAELLFTDNWTNLLAAVKVMAPSFVILDQGLPEGSPLELARKLITVNAMINIIVVTDLDGERFHEASEGLGVLAPLPVHPTAQDGEKLAKVVKRFLEGTGAALPEKPES
jgi:DNA-binding response OmpR family regulator